MYKIKISFETEEEMINFTSKLETATKYAAAFEQIDQNLRSLIKHTEDDILETMIMESCEIDHATPRDAIEMCRDIIFETLGFNGIREIY